MAVSESRRRANNKWDAANMTTLGCRMRKTDAEIFKAACKDSGTTVNAVFAAAAVEFLKNYKEGKNYGTD